ncbi:hypothetical protein C5Y96_05655 [Blastopirellula marina]|uniref:Uncharacterized protein n=1 Tax=Blastopirellula marina TaxID=124 RepID=A0A2S8G4F7_9BACT|nr:MULTISPECIES: hypothetical protein [Pirellulaceae]PQO39339.1 hypothetical protein C5Y96_05655 [Blastopirellula marina]RCS55647.1 hypothetical protein DTL36_05665 [Bremerella cremea]
MGTVNSFKEIWHSRKVHSATKAKDSTSQIVYLAIGTTDLTHLEAETYAKTNGPGNDANLLRETIDLDEICPGYFRCTFNFVHPDAPESKDDQQPGDPTEFSFDTSGGQTHITTSLGTTRYGTNPPDCKGAIGVTEPDKVEGVDIIVPQFRFSVKTTVAAAAVTLAFVKTLSERTGTVNDAPFKGWAAGEVLFLGVSGQQRGGGDWDLSFSFAMEKNKTGLQIGDITGIDKKGHQYLWVRFAAQKDAANYALVRRPTAVYVEDVYESTDFGDLGIGT